MSCAGILIVSKTLVNQEGEPTHGDWLSAITQHSLHILGIFVLKDVVST